MLAIALIVAAQVVNTQTQTQPRPGGSPRDSRPTVTGTAVIRGRVFAADTGRPLRRARIVVTAPELGPDPRQTSTNAEGRYELKDLPAGRYTVTVNRAGYLQLRYGQRRPLEQGKPLQVIDKQALENVDFSLPRMSVITGRVLDEANENVAGAQVFAMRSMYFEGRRRLVPAGFGPIAQTDDAGQFRILGLPPGTYYLRAIMRDTWTVSEGGVEQTYGYAPTYYPSTTNIGDARRIAVGIGQEAPNMDIALIPGRAVTVSGLAFDSHGRPLSGQSVGLNQETRGPSMMMMMSVGNSNVTSEGAFTIRNVPPGEYKVMARTSGDQGAEAVAVPIVVNGVDIDNLSLTSVAGGTISGQFVADTGGIPNVPRDRVRVAARPVNSDAAPVGGPPGGLGSPNSGRMKDDGTFAIADVYGAARLRVTLPDGWMVKAIVLNNREVGESSFDLRSGEELSGIQIVLSNKVSTLTGQLADDKGAPLTDGTVIVFSDDAEKWTEDSRFVRSARPDQQGQYQIRGLPAGEYLAVAVDYVQDGMWNDPEFLEAMRRYAQRVTVGEGDARSLSLKLTSVEVQP